MIWDRTRLNLVTNNALLAYLDEYLRTVVSRSYSARK